MKIIFFRHGETDSNVKEIMQGAGVDTPLNVKGIKQAQELADKVKGLGLEKIYSSTLTRAIQTATLVAAKCGLDVEPIANDGSYVNTQDVIVILGSDQG